MKSPTLASLQRAFWIKFSHEHKEQLKWGQMRTILLFLTLISYGSLFANEPLVLGSAQKGGGYHNLALSIQKVLQDHNISIKVQETQGSVDNLEKIKDGKINLAIVQNDTAYYAENSKFAFEKETPYDNISTVISFYREPIFILTNQRNINHISQLSNKKINVGIIKSGLSASAKVLLKSSKILESETLYYADSNRSLNMLLSNSIDVIFVNEINNEMQQNLRDKKIFIVPIKKEIIDGLHKTFPYFSSYEYTVDTSNAIITLAVTSILIADKNIDRDHIFKIVKVLHDKYNRLDTTQKLKNHFTANSLSEWHSGTLLFAEENNILLNKDTDFNENVIYIIVASIIFIILISLLAMFIIYHADMFHRYTSSHLIVQIFHNIYKKASEHKYLVFFIIFILLYLMLVLLLKYFEHGWAVENNIISEFDNFTMLKSLSWLFVFGSSGYNGEIFPSSEEGKIIASVTPLLGVGGIIGLIGLIALDQFKKHLLEVNGLGAKRAKNHIILCGWNNNAHNIIDHLLHKNITNKKQIVILADMKYEDDIKNYHFDQMYVSYVKGQATNKEDLRRANIAGASTAIVIPDNSTSDADARTILKILTIEKYCEELTEDNKCSKDINIHTIAEINDKENIEIAENAGAKQIVSINGIESDIFAQAVQNPGVAKFINEVVTYNDENDIYSIAIEENSQLCNKTYDNILTILRKHKILLLSINIENTRPKNEVQNIMKINKLKKAIITNPFDEEEASYHTQKGDLIIVLAQFGKDIEHAVKNLKL